jgi:hypothetical protein
MSLNIFRRLSKNGGVIAHLAYPGVAHCAEKPANFAGAMAMIDMEAVANPAPIVGVADNSLAYSAFAVLLAKHFINVFYGKAVVPLETMLLACCLLPRRLMLPALSSRSSRCIPHVINVLGGPLRMCGAGAVSTAPRKAIPAAHVIGKIFQKLASAACAAQAPVFIDKGEAREFGVLFAPLGICAGSGRLNSFWVGFRPLCLGSRHAWPAPLVDAVAPWNLSERSDKLLFPAFAASACSHLAHLHSRALIRCQ